MFDQSQFLIFKRFVKNPEEQRQELEKQLEVWQNGDFDEVVCLINEIILPCFFKMCFMIQEILTFFS